MYLQFFMFYLMILGHLNHTVLTFRQKTTTPHPPCNIFQWQCDNGECIYSDDRCDGVYNCSDGSDETTDHCIHLPCPTYAFRCAYGACITGNNKCNGHRDCVDNSDETDFQCATDLYALERTLQGTCGSSLLIQCKSGECIKTEDRCDGVYDCKDHSDETVELCSYLFCPSYAFRCGYGGCVRGNAKCDGVIDCVDGSDEALDLCGYDRDHKKNATDIGVITPPVVHKVQFNGCLIPFTLNAMHAQNVYTGEYLQLGTTVPAGTFVRFECDAHHVLEGTPQNECGENWRFSFPSCTKYCPNHTINKGISTIVERCEYKNYAVNCSSYLREDTIAYVSCADGYKLPKNPNHQQMEIRCDKNHEWNYPKLKCQPKCGILEKGDAVPLSETPWHVSIYKNNMNKLLRLCGGTIISPKLIITAAKCFPIIDPLAYNILPGHQALILEHKDLNGKEVHNLSDIFLAPNDIDDKPSDLAFATVVNYFDFGKPNIMPICLQEKTTTTTTTTQSIMAYQRKQLSKAERQKLGYIDIGYALSLGSNDATHQQTLEGVILNEMKYEKLERERDEDILFVINVNYYIKFIKKAIRKYRYIL